MAVLAGLWGGCFLHRGYAILMADAIPECLGDGEDAGQVMRLTSGRFEGRLGLRSVAGGHIGHVSMAAGQVVVADGQGFVAAGRILAAWRPLRHR